MEKARYNTELYSNLRVPLYNVKPSNFWGSHHFETPSFFIASLFVYLSVNLQRLSVIAGARLANVNRAD